MKQFLPVLLLATTILTSFDHPISNQQKTVTGKVVGTANEGITDAHVYVVAGEEETLSVKDGEFSLKTWQPLPLVLVIEHSDFEKHRILIRASDKPVTIKLSERKN
jgi:thiamine phosphate synthase YjbQ (UPF0047 family)